MTSAVIEFTTPLTHSPHIYVNVEDGRVFKTALPEHVGLGVRVSAIIDRDAMFMYIPDKEDSEGEAILEPIGEVCAESVDELVVPAEIVQDSTSRGDSLFTAAAKNPAVAALLVEAKKIDDAYKLSENAKRVVDRFVQAVDSTDKRYHVTETMKKTAAEVGTKVNEADASLGVSAGIKGIDEKYRVSETATGTMEKASGCIRDFDDSYKVSDTVKKTPAVVAGTVSDIGASLTHQAQLADEKYHIRDNMKVASDTVLSTARDVDEKYHVTDTIKTMADTLTKEVSKLANTSTGEGGKEDDEEKVVPVNP